MKIGVGQHEGKGLEGAPEGVFKRFDLGSEVVKTNALRARKRRTESNEIIFWH